MSFEPITTQEQLNAVIGYRLADAKKAAAEAAAAEYADYNDIKAELETAKQQLAELGNSLNESTNAAAAKDATIADLQQQLSAHVTNTVKMRIAQEYGLDLSLANRLNGTTEEEIKADAEALKAIVGNTVVHVPMASTEPQNDKDAPYRALLKGMKGE